MFVPFLLIHCLLDFLFTRGLGFQKHQVFEMGRKSRKAKAAEGRLFNQNPHQTSGDFGRSRQNSSNSNSSSSGVALNSSSYNEDYEGDGYVCDDFDNEDYGCDSYGYAGCDDVNCYHDMEEEEDLDEEEKWELSIVNYSSASAKAFVVLGPVEQLMTEMKPKKEN
jgi:hypothetical protein